MPHNDSDVVSPRLSDAIELVVKLHGRASRKQSPVPVLAHRFNAPKADQLWYYRSAAEAYREVGFTGPVLTELDRLVDLLHRLA